MTTTRRFATLLFSLLLMVGLAKASTITAISAGNGIGLNDGAYYVGFVTLMIDGEDYSALCIDSLHEATIGETWSGLVTSLTDTAALTPIMDAQFGAGLTPDVFDPKLGADVVAFYSILTNPGNNAVIDLQHSVWGQFDPRYDGQALAQSAPLILASGSMSNGSGGQIPVSINGFSIVSDSTNVTQAFIIDSTPDPAPEPVTLGLIGTGLVLLGVLRRRRHVSV
jgi:hypothetical protein